MSADLPEWARKAKPGWAIFQERHGLVDRHGDYDGLPGLKTLTKVREIEGQLIGLTPPAPVAPLVTAFSYGGEDMKRGISRDPLLLLPGFAAKVELLFQAIREDGFDPFLWEAYRSPERARAMQRKGTGIRKSMHCLYAAVDIVEADLTPWSVPRGFWDSVSDNAEDLGMFVLHNRKGRRKDRPHVQAVSVKDQNKFRAMTEAEQREFVV